MSTLFEKGIVVPLNTEWYKKFKEGYIPSLKELTALHYEEQVEFNLHLTYNEKTKISEAVRSCGDCFNPRTGTWDGPWVRSHRLSMIALGIDPESYRAELCESDKTIREQRIALLLEQLTIIERKLEQCKEHLESATSEWLIHEDESSIRGYEENIRTLKKEISRLEKFPGESALF